MKLRAKTLLIVGATLLALLGGLYASARWIVLDGFGEIEQREARESVAGAQSAIDRELTQLESTTGDWAGWDDTYNFALDQNQSYIDGNLTDDALTTLRINLLMLVDTSGAPIYTKSVDLESGTSNTLPVTSRAEILSAQALYDFDSPEEGTRGLIAIPEGPMLISAKPVTTSAGEGPVTASLMMGRYMDAAMIKELEASAGGTVSLHRLGDVGAPNDVAGLERQFSQGRAILVEPVDGGTIGGYTLLEDVRGEPALIVRVLMPRDLFAQGVTTAWYLLGALAFAGALFALVVVVLLERAVLSRLRSLSNQVAQIATDNDPGSRVHLGGHDEVSDLAGAINTLMGTIERTIDGRDRAEEQLMQLNRELTDERGRIESLNRSLEASVAERTADLEIANEQLRQRNRQLVDARTQASTDALTGLGNHRAFHQQIREAIDQNRSHVGLVIVDLDNFKAINDTEGHLAGDQILRGLARALMEMGLAEAAYRYGGDEFAIILRGEDQTAIVSTAEQVRIAVQTRLDGVGNVTVSVGAASYPETADTAEELIYGADSAMYWAKSAGKNRVGDWSLTRREGAGMSRRAR
jgi:diguanylate cyclase (GGDEF)-like protein